MDLLISGATVLTMDADLRVLPDAFVGITGGKISFLGKAAPVEKPKKIMDATGSRAMVWGASASVTVMEPATFL